MPPRKSRQVGDLDEVIRARRSVNVPAVMTAGEVRDVLGQLPGYKWPIASLLNGCGLRLLECLRLRHRIYLSPTGSGWPSRVYTKWVSRGYLAAQILTGSEGR